MSAVAAVQTPDIAPPSIVAGLSNEDYHGGAGISSSQLKAILHSPAHYREAQAHPKQASAAMDQGSAAHALILEPDTFDQQFAVAPKFDKRTKAGKADAAAFEAQLNGRTSLSEEAYKHAQGMASAVRAHAVTRILLAPEAIEAERSHYWIDPTTGLLCKCRPDAWNDDHDLVLDVKTVAPTDYVDASKTGFKRQVLKFGYNMPAAYYLDGVAQTGLKPQAYVFVAVESAPPYAVGVYTLPELMLRAGRLLYRRALDSLADCQTRNAWPGYPEEVRELEFSKYDTAIPDR